MSLFTQNIKLSGFFVVLTIVLHAGSVFTLPPEWKQEESDRPLGGGGITIRHYTTHGIQASIVDTPPALTAGQQEVSAEGAITGMQKNGYTHQKTLTETFDGRPMLHLVGEYRSKEFEGAYFSDVYLIFSSDVTTMVSVTVDDGLGGRELGNVVLANIKLSAPPPPLQAVSNLPPANISYVNDSSSHYEIAKKAGYWGFSILLGGYLLKKFSAR